MRILKNLTLATRIYALVFAVLALTAGLVAFSLDKVKDAEKVLKYTIDNRMMSVVDLDSIANTLGDVVNVSRSVYDKHLSPEEGGSQIKTDVQKTHDLWDKYFLADMIPEEQKLAEETTPDLDALYLAIDKLQGKLKAGDLAGMEDFRVNQVRPLVSKVGDKLEKLGALQVVAAGRDLDRTKEGSAKSALHGYTALAAVLGGALLLAWLIMRGVMKRLGADPARAADIARRISAGDYVFEMPRAPEESLVGALGQMRANLLHSKLDYEGQIRAIGETQAVVEFSPDGTVTGANELFLKSMGYTLAEVVGKHHSLFVGEQERNSGTYAGFWKALAAGQPQRGVIRRQSRTGKLLWLQATYTPIADLEGKIFKVVKYAADVTREHEEAAMNAAFKGALNEVSASLMVADTEGRIIYLNKQGGALMAHVESDFRKDLPDFQAKALMGSSLDVLDRGGSQQRQQFASITETHRVETSIGGRTMRLVANPMKDEGGRRLGTVIEWFDRTQEVATEKELQEVIGAVTEGDLSRRIALSGKSGFFETLSRGINDLVDSVGTVVDEVQALVAAANSGDLTRRVETQGKAGLLVKIGTGINQLTDNMANVVAQVKSAASEVSRGADEISQGNTNLSQRTEQQASSLEETASSMEEMTSTVKQNADNAGQANQLAVAARDQAEKGGAVVAKAVKAMSEINEASKKIADIIGVIDEIAFQTNLLALNAAVEAARAGEQGRGFAVVASEVRNLAGRSATAAKEIKALIQDSVKKVDEGSSLVTQSGSTLDQIVAAVKKVTDIVAEIAAASHEQSAGIDQVNKAVMQLDELTQQNAALVEEASAASQAMAEQARGLNERMSAYKVDAQLALAAMREVPKAAAAAKTAPPASGERRKATRPWSGTSAMSRDGGAAKTGTDNEVWKEF